MDITACPGTDSCKLGIASSRGLAVSLRDHFSSSEMTESIKDLRVKISGCPNSCGTHHIANIGFFGSSRRLKGHIAPYYQVTLGGHDMENAGSYGLAAGKIHGKHIPEFIEELTGRYLDERTSEDDTFTDYIGRLGKPEIKSILKQYDQIPTYEEDPSYYIDTGDTKEFKLQKGVGECAGQLVELVSFKLEEGDRLIYEAGVHLEEKDFEASVARAFEAMIRAADGLLTTEGIQYIDDENTVREFRDRYYDTQIFFSAYAEHLFKSLEERGIELNEELTHRRVEEATLFVEQAHNVYGRMQIRQEEEQTRSRGRKKESVPARIPEPVVEAESIVDSMDLKGVACPYNYVQTKIRLEQMSLGELLEITIDDGEPIQNVPASLINDGHKIIDTKKIGQYYRLTIRKGE
jgi:sulfite reductase (ferredoxin)